CRSYLMGGTMDILSDEKIRQAMREAIAEAQDYGDHYEPIPERRVAQAQLDDAQKKFGTTSALFDGTNDYLSLLDSADWNFGTGQFTVEFWVRYNAFTGSGRPWMVGQMGQTDSTQVWGVAGAATTVANTFIFYFHDGALATLTGTRAAGDFVFNTQYHIAVDRDASNIIRIYFDGVISGSVTDSANIRNLVRPLHIGQREGASSGTENLDGWIDEVRITKGVARYAGAFTPPDNPFPKA
ncbi:hypothetical protein LCGC14_2106310, partial [marine sediment metagenome]